MNLFILQLSDFNRLFILSYILLNIFKDNLRVLINSYSLRWLYKILSLLFMRGGRFCGKQGVAATGILATCHCQWCFLILLWTELSDFGFLPVDLFCLFLSCWFPPFDFTHFPVESLLIVFRISLRHIWWHLEFSTQSCVFCFLSLSPYTNYYSSWIDLFIPSTPSPNLPWGYFLLLF